MSNQINFAREKNDGYSPLNLSCDIHIVGVGALGSKICQGLFQMGLPQNGKQIHIHDFDTVESHNVSNQAYGIEHIGMLKVDAMKQIVERVCGADGKDLVTHVERVDKATHLDGIVVLTPDTIEARREAVKGTSKFKPLWWVDCRMTTNMGYVMCIQNTPVEVKKYAAVHLTDIPSSDEPIRGCGVPSVGATSSFISSLACWNIRKILSTGKPKPPQILIAMLDPFGITEAKL